MADRIRPRRLDEVLDEHSTVEPDSLSRAKYRVFTASGNVYREVHLPAIDNYNRMYVPILDGIERSDLRIVAAPSDAAARLLQREGIIE
jgi:hypothetical protein